MGIRELNDVYSIRYEHANDLKNALKYEFGFDQCTGCSCCCGCKQCAEDRFRNDSFYWTENWGESGKPKQ